MTKERRTNSRSTITPVNIAGVQHISVNVSDAEEDTKPNPYLSEEDDVQVVSRTPSSRNPNRGSLSPRISKAQTIQESSPFSPKRSSDVVAQENVKKPKVVNIVSMVQSSIYSFPVDTFVVVLT